MKILLLDFTDPRRGGKELGSNSARCLRGAGHEVTLVNMMKSAISYREICAEGMNSNSREIQRQHITDELDTTSGVELPLLSHGEDLSSLGHIASSSGGRSLARDSLPDPEFDRAAL